MLDNLYLKRMKYSANTSTKSDIPRRCHGNVLDIGCADGSLLEYIQKVNHETRLYGVEPNPEMADLARERGFTIYNSSIEDLIVDDMPKFDTIIFSSVLHEISSYSKIENLAFTSQPIVDALEKVSKLLRLGGQIIIRDGIQADSSDVISFSFKDPTDKKYIQKFNNEWAGMKHMNTLIAQHRLDLGFKEETNNTFVCSELLAKEFFFTYTWGENSWKREVQEQFGILTETDWRVVINHIKQRNKLKLIYWHTNSEEYAKYISEKIEIDTEKLYNLFKQSVINIILVKTE